MKLIPCPIDNKNLTEDAFEDGVFKNFYAAKDHRKNKTRHLLCWTHGEDYYNSPDAEGVVEVFWRYADYRIAIRMIAVPPTEDFDTTKEAVFDYLKKTFKSWECSDNPGLKIQFKQVDDTLHVSFFYEVEEC